MRKLKVKEVKGMTPAPKIFIICLGKKNMRFIHRYIHAFTYDLSREKLQGINKGRITAFIHIAHRLDLIKMGFDYI